MNNDEKARVFARHIGGQCRVWINGQPSTCPFDGELLGVYKQLSLDKISYTWLAKVRDGIYVYDTPLDNCKPILRRVESITEDELIIVNSLWKDMRGKGYVSGLDVSLSVKFGTLFSKIADFLRSIGIDCDGLIESNRGLR